MLRYSPERKAALLKKLLTSLNLSVAELACHDGISEVTLHAWRKQAKAGGAAVAGDSADGGGTTLGHRCNPVHGSCFVADRSGSWSALRR